jgi:hypothetical protein
MPAKPPAREVARVTSERRDAMDSWRPTLLLTLLALAVRAAAFFRLPELSYDGTYYLRQAQRLATLHYDLVSFPPGYPFATLLLRLAVRDWVVAGRLVSLLAGTATILLFHRWTRRSLPPALVLAGTLFLALDPHLVQSNVETLSESLYLVVTLSAVLLFEARRDLATGILLGYAFLVRPEALLLLVGFAFVRILRERRVPWTLLVGLVPIAVYALLASRTVGHPVVSPKEDQLDLGPQVLTRFWTVVRSLHAAFPILLVPGAVAYGIRTRSHRLIPVLYGLTLPWFAIHVQPRLHVPALPFFTVLALGWIATLPVMTRRLALGVAALLCAIGIAPWYRTLASPRELVPHAREIGAALRPYLRFEDRVAGRFPMPAYYGGAGFVRVPIANYWVTMDSLAKMRPTHLLVLESEMIGILPHLRPLYENLGFIEAEGRLDQVACIEPAPGARALLYRFHAPAIPDSVARLARRDVLSAAWLGPRLVLAGRDGDLHDGGTLHEPPGARLPGTDAPGAAPPLFTSPEIESQPSASPDGTKLVFCQEAGGTRWIAARDAATGGVRAYRQTSTDQPAAPTYAAGQILYVRQAEPAGLRALDPRTGQLRNVVLVGVDGAKFSPVFVAARNRDVAVTYMPRSDAPDPHRIVALATWPNAPGGADVELQGSRATRLLLGDDAVCWVPDSENLLVSVLVSEVGNRGEVVRSHGSLCVLRPDGTFRRLTFGLQRPRQPTMRTGQVVFVSGDAELRTAPLAAEALRFPPARAFSLTP